MTTDARTRNTDLALADAAIVACACGTRHMVDQACPTCAIARARSERRIQDVRDAFAREHGLSAECAA